MANSNHSCCCQPFDLLLLLMAFDPLAAHLCPQMRKKRHAKLQEERQYWSKKKMGRKTSNERKKKAHHRPKH